MNGYTIEEMQKAETTKRIMESIPEGQRSQATMMINAFLLGFESSEEAASEPKAVNQ